MGLRKENGGRTHETKTASVSSTASISFLHWVSHYAAAARNSFSGEREILTLRMRATFVHRGSQGILVAGKPAGLPSVLHCGGVPH